MLNRRLSAMLVALPLAGCSGHSLLPAQNARFTVESVPVGASVLVLGETVGQTPMSLTTREVFPQHFEQNKQYLYGRVEISHPGCDSFITTVSSRVISDGIKADLQCNREPIHQGATYTQTTTPGLPLPAEAAPLKQRLQQLKELFEEDLISEKDYAEKRKQLLDEL